MSSSRKKSKSKSRRRGEGGSSTAPSDDFSSDAMRNDIMAQMAKFMADPAAAAKELGNPGLAYAGRPIPKEEMLKLHRETRAQLLGPFSQNTFQTAFSIVNHVKPKMPRAQIASLRPICVKDLSVGTTHKGCVLDGVILELPVFMSGVHTIAEDKNGEAFMLSVYNIPGANLQMADNYFPVGARVKVLEPYYKAVTSGGFGVRVEDPAEVKIYRKDEIVDFREEGNRLFGLKDFAGASGAYTSGLMDAKTLSVCLANASACCLELNWDIVAYNLAVCSLTVNPSYEKAWFRGLTCLSRLGRISEARKFYVEAPSGAHAVLKPLLENISGGQRRTSKTSTPFGTVLQESLESLLPRADLDTGKSRVTDGVNVDKIKEKGNGFFKKREFERALGCYLTAIRAHDDDQKLLSNRAACNFKLNKFEQAVLDATTAVVVGIENVRSLDKALFRRASALRELELYGSALDTVDFASSKGIQLDELAELKKELQELVSLSPEGPRGTTRPKHNQPTHEDEVHEIMQDGTVRGSSLSMVADMMKMFPGKDMDDMLDSRVPEFHLDFFKEGHLPPQCNAKMCQEWALNAFEETRLSPMMTSAFVDLKSVEDVTPEYVLRRLGTNAREDLTWWMTAPVGDVRDVPKWRADFGYSMDALHSFGNVWPRPIDLRFGTTHVGVGYVDLGVLIAGNFVGSKDDGAVRFVGYETSVYSTAKTGVLAEMLRMGAPVDCILQVWYSSAWSTETMKAFRTALLGLTKKGSLPPAALDVCKFWLGVPQIPLLIAQEKWLQLHPQHHTIPGNLARKRDRTEVLQYMLTGRLLQKDCEVGSVVMFGNPPDLPHLVHEESVLLLVSLEEISGLYGDHNSLMNCVVELLRRRIAKARDLFLDGKIEVNLVLKGVTVGDERVQRDIAKLKPWTMSWSNLCDYSRAEDFHKMLKSCSGPNTVHYMHTMNWLIQVKGTDLNDYVTFPDGLPSQRSVYNSAKKWMTEMVAKSAKGLLISPPVYHPNNLVNARHAGVFFDSWLRMFLKAGGVTEKQTGNVHVRKFSFFCRAEGNAYFSFTYADKIRSD